MNLKELKEKIESIENLVADDTEVYIADSDEDDGSMYLIKDIFIGEDEEIIILT